MFSACSQHLEIFFLPAVPTEHLDRKSQPQIPTTLHTVPLNEETWENEVADVHLNVPWAQQAEEKSLNVGCQKQTLQFMKIFILNFF